MTQTVTTSTTIVADKDISFIIDHRYPVSFTDSSSTWSSRQCHLNRRREKSVVNHCNLCGNL